MGYALLQISIFCAPLLTYPKVRCATVLENSPFSLTA